MGHLVTGSYVVVAVEKMTAVDANALTFGGCAEAMSYRELAILSEVRGQYCRRWRLPEGRNVVYATADWA